MNAVVEKTEKLIEAPPVKIELVVPAQFYRIVREIAHVRGMKVQELLLDNAIPGLEHDLEVNEALAYRYGFEELFESEQGFTSTCGVQERLRELAGLDG